MAAEEPDDDTLLDLIGAVGAGINASKDEGLPLDVSELAADLADKPQTGWPSSRRRRSAEKENAYE